ncbi:Long-Chain Acyl-CoA Synthetase [Zostera marina]|uniref:Long-chain-fatty-acid--CoA ligase n=1 Tax=Zostera marina TaxID=29655 RepID=A0A0K9P2Z4_ZOSMR|nr:Long-Chain Acyl-CoA Synthetase [Zostera marina]
MQFTQLLLLKRFPLSILNILISILIVIPKGLNHISLATCFRSSPETSKMEYLKKVEEGVKPCDGRPSIGPTYRSFFAKDGFPSPDREVSTCWDIFRISADKNADKNMLGRRKMVDGKVGEYVWSTYGEVYETVIKVGASIRSCGVEKAGRCGIYGINSPEWIISMEACNAHGIYCVPLYDTLGSGAVEFILCHAEVSIVFVEEKKIPEVLKTFPNSTKHLKTLVSFGSVAPEQKSEVEKFGLKIYSWEEFLCLGENKQFEFPEVKSSDICTIMYTSGTTGDPKGVLITNDNVINVIAGSIFQLECVNETLNSNDVYLSYLPLAHIFDRVIEEMMISRGASIGFWQGDVKLLIDDIGKLKPTLFCAVPRVLDRIYTGLKTKIAAGGFIKSALFKYAYSHKFHNMKKGFPQDKASPFFDKLVFSKVKQGLGGNVKLILSGAAPLANHVEEYLRVVTCCHVLQGYGLTETCAGTFTSLPDNLEMLGTVGPPIPNVDIRLESVPEMGYDALSELPRGEVCVRGKTVFSGYYKREDLTNEVLIDGWFHTGDIGEWMKNGSLKIIDRKKNIFKLSQGEYVAVENLENVYGSIPDIDMIWVYGNSFESYLVGVVNPNQQALEHWAHQHGIEGDYASLCQNDKAKEYILREISKVATSHKMRGFEVLKGIYLDSEPFDIERDLITPTYKKKRPQLKKYYQGEIDKLYKHGK